MKQCQVCGGLVVLREDGPQCYSCGGMRKEWYRAGGRRKRRQAGRRHRRQENTRRSARYGAAASRHCGALAKSTSATAKP